MSKLGWSRRIAPGLDAGPWNASRLKLIFEDTLGENDWTWIPETRDEQGEAISVIQKDLPDVNIFKSEDWPAIISFLKARIIAIDNFWSLVRYQFSNL